MSAEWQLNNMLFKVYHQELVILSGSSQLCDEIGLHPRKKNVFDKPRTGNSNILGNLMDSFTLKDYVLSC